MIDDFLLLKETVLDRRICLQPQPSFGPLAVFTCDHRIKTMNLVSYIDILDYVGADRQCLIAGEEVFNQSKVEGVQVSCRDTENSYEVSVVCVCKESTSKNSDVSIEIRQNEKREVTAKCSCDTFRLGKCHHVAATLIYLHRYPPAKSNSIEQTTTSQSDNFIATPRQNRKPQRKQKVRLKHKASNNSESPTQNNSKAVILKGTKTEREDEDLTNDPTWDKENDGDEDEVFDGAQSSDEDWKPPKNKRARHDIRLLSSKDSKDVIENRKSKKRLTKAAADQKAKELAAAVTQGDSDEYSCPTCNVKVPKLDQLQDHIRDIHLLSKGCSKCSRVFRLSKSLRAHEATCNVISEVDDEVFSSQVEIQNLEISDEEPSVQSLRCLLCEAEAHTRLEMRNHYLLAHDKDSVAVCDRCGEFRLPRDHICPSQLSFRCRICRLPFKTGRDYWNHLIRASRKHGLGRGGGGGGGGGAAWRCGWARCGEAFPAEDGLLAHARLHLPAHVLLMCGVCQLVLRTTDAKIVHMEKHDAAVYECAACRQACADKAALRAHWDAHAAERPHLCAACGWRFASEEALQVHVRRFHEGGPFCCAKCPIKFADRTDVRVHFSAAHGKLRCGAALCAFRCGNRASLQRHARLAHPDLADLDDPVDLAPAPAPAASPALRRPRGRRGAEGAKGAKASFECRDCGKTFKAQRDLEEHQRLHTGEKPFICAECGMTFKRAQNLDYHTKGAHKNERNFVCPDCGKRFISNADVQRHLRYHHQGGKKWHLCPECGHRLPSLYNLKLHVQSKHTGERPHKCTQCDSGFVTPSDLKKHVMFKHNQEQPFACAQCAKRYQRRRDLDVHVKRHHAGQHHACPTCGKDFDSYASMMQHARYHTSEEAFQCAKCGRRFPHRMNLSRHLCLPDIKKNFPCATCGISFTTGSSLKSHRRRLHAAEEAQAQPGPARATRARRSGGGGKRPDAGPGPEPEPEQPPQLDQAPPPQQQEQAYPPPPTPHQTSVVLQLPQHHAPREEVHRQHEMLEQHQEQAAQPLQPLEHEPPPQQQLRQAVVVHAAREPDPAEHDLHLEQVDQPPFEDKLWRGLEADAWALGALAPVDPVVSTASEEALMSLADCASYSELQGAQATAPQPVAVHAAPAPAPPPTVLRYEPAAAGAAAAAALVVSKSEPPPLIALSTKTDLPHMMYAPAPAAAAASAVKLVSVSQSQPPPLATLSPAAPAQSSLILGAPIQTTADGSFHLVFVPHGPTAK